MKKKITLLTLCAMLLALCSSADAQQTGKVARIGCLHNSTAAGSVVLVEAFWQELSKLGWIEGKNITIEYRFAEQKLERLPSYLHHQSKPSFAVDVSYSRGSHIDGFAVLRNDRPVRHG